MLFRDNGGVIHTPPPARMTTPTKKKLINNIRLNERLRKATLLQGRFVVFSQ